MERLTRLSSSEDIELTEFTDYSWREVIKDEDVVIQLDIENVIEKLYEYEDLEEQGLLLKLPCKVGDTVWVIDEYENNYDGYLFMASCGEYVIVAVEYAHCTGDFNIQLLEMVDESYDNFGVDVEIYHKDKVFLTKEEAEKALERLECTE